MMKLTLQNSGVSINRYAFVEQQRNNTAHTAKTNESTVKPNLTTNISSSSDQKIEAYKNQMKYKGNLKNQPKNSTLDQNIVSVLLVEEKTDRSSIIKKSLIDCRYHVTKHVNFEGSIVEQIEHCTPDILVLATEQLSDKILKQLGEVNQLSPLPIVIFSENDSPSIIKSVIKVGVSAFVVHEVLPQHLKSIISVARERFKEVQSLRNELKQAKTQLESRKYVERAKGLIMKQKQIDENEAYKTLRKMAMDQGSSLAVVAKNIIDVCELLSTGKNATKA